MRLTAYIATILCTCYGTVVGQCTTADAGPDQVVCHSLTAQLAANTPGSGLVGEWREVSINGGISFIPDANSPNATASGLTNLRSYRFEWKITDPTGICPTDSDEVIIRNQKADVGDTVEVCNTDIIYIAPSQSPGIGRWRPLQGATGINATTGLIDLQKTGDGLFLYEYFAPNYCPDTLYLDVIAHPTIAFSSTPPYFEGYPIYVKLPDGRISFHIESENTPTTVYEWDFGDGDRSALKNPEHTYTNPGSYTLQLSAYDKSCKSDPEHLSVDILVQHDIQQIKLVNVLTPNGDGINDVFRVSQPDMMKQTIVILDRYGRRLYDTEAINGDPIEWDCNIDGSPVAAGVYFYHYVGEHIGGDEIVRNGSITLIK